MPSAAEPLIINPAPARRLARLIDSWHAEQIIRATIRISALPSDAILFPPHCSPTSPCRATPDLPSPPQPLSAFTRPTTSSRPGRDNRHSEDAKSVHVGYE